MHIAQKLSMHGKCVAKQPLCTDLAPLVVNQPMVSRLARSGSAATTAMYGRHIDDGMRRDAIAELTGAG